MMKAGATTRMTWAKHKARPDRLEWGSHMVVKFEPAMIEELQLPDLGVDDFKGSRAQLVEYIDPWNNCAIPNCCSPLVGTWVPHGDPIKPGKRTYSSLQCMGWSELMKPRM